MPAEIEPPELARLVDLAERPRVDDWSLRSALVRYAQPEPGKVRDLLELVRRIEFALRPHAKLLEKQGPAVWAALGGADPGDVPPLVVGVLQASTDLDAVGDVLADWAAQRTDHRPDAAVADAIGTVAKALDELGVASEEWERPPPGARRRG